MENKACPKCSAPLGRNDASGVSEQYQCHSCQQTFRQTAICPDCTHKVEKIQACGSVSYFCGECNELKSRSRIGLKFESE